MQSFRRSLRKWPDVYTCALVCACVMCVCVWGAGERGRSERVTAIIFGASTDSRVIQ